MSQHYSDAKHTPEPWYVSERGQTHDTDRTIYARTASGNPRWIARVYGEGIPTVATNERTANARLIAAAPELLEALCEALTLFESCLDGRPQTRAVADLARAAIAKATGA